MPVKYNHCSVVDAITTLFGKYGVVYTKTSLSSTRYAYFLEYMPKRLIPHYSLDTGIYSTKGRHLSSEAIIYMSSVVFPVLLFFLKCTDHIFCHGTRR